MGELCGVDMINVCFFSGDITRSGGTERVATVIANELQKNNEYRVSFVSMWENGDKPFFYIDDSIKRFTLYGKEKKGFHHLLGYIKRLRKIVKKNNFDILVDVDGILDMYSIPALIGLKTKLISWEQFNYYQNPYVNYRKLTRRMAAKLADAIVVITKEDEQYYRDNLKLKTTVYQIYNPLTIDNKGETADLESKTILSVGRITEQKGFDMLVDVAEKVLQDHKDWKWIIIGDGEDKDEILQKIKEKGLEGNINILSNVDNVEEYYKNSSIYVMTSRYEGFGLVLTEAMSFGVPCVSFKCPAGPSEIIEDGVNGYLVDCFDINTMSKRIKELIVNKNNRINCSQKTVIIKENFNLEDIVQKWNEILLKIGNNNGE